MQAMWEERKARAGKEAEEERDLQRINKLYIAAGDRGVRSLSGSPCLKHRSGFPLGACERARPAQESSSLGFCASRCMVCTTNSLEYL